MPKGKYCDMTVYFNKRSHPLLGNSKSNMFQLLWKHVSSATDTHTKRKELLEAVFSMRPVPGPYKENQLSDP
jgi:hypothetical protein